MYVCMCVQSCEMWVCCVSKLDSLHCECNGNERSVFLWLWFSITCLRYGRDSTFVLASGLKWLEGPRNSDPVQLLGLWMWALVRVWYCVCVHACVVYCVFRWQGCTVEWLLSHNSTCQVDMQVESCGVLVLYTFVAVTKCVLLCCVVLCCVVCILYIMYIHMCSVCPSHVQHSHIQSTYNITVINLPHTVHANRLQSLHVWLPLLTPFLLLAQNPASTGTSYPTTSAAAATAAAQGEHLPQPCWVAVTMGWKFYADVICMHVYRMKHM